MIIRILNRESRRLISANQDTKPSCFQVLTHWLVSYSTDEVSVSMPA